MNEYRDTSSQVLIKIARQADHYEASDPSVRSLLSEMADRLETALADITILKITGG